MGGVLAGQVLLETELLNPETPLDEDEVAKQERIRRWQSVIVSKGLLPPRDRAAAGSLLASLGDDRPGVQTCDGMQFCLVPPGPFWMAADDQGQRGNWIEGLDKPYWLAQYPVTVAQFREFVQDAKYEPSYGKSSLAGPHNLPVGWVHWYDALAFVEWLDARWRSYLPPGYRVSLPSELEWEKAARGGKEIPVAPHLCGFHNFRAALAETMMVKPNEENGQSLSQRTYPWGDAPAQTEKRGEVSIYRANNGAAGIGKRSAVGAFPLGASPVGCHDMAGNVDEWTRSLYKTERPTKLLSAQETVNPRNKKPMVLRGGMYNDEDPGCGARLRYNPNVNYVGLYGFRVVLSPFFSDR